MLNNDAVVSACLAKLGFDHEIILQLDKKYHPFFSNFIHNLESSWSACAEYDKTVIFNMLKLASLYPSDEHTQLLHSFLWIVAFEEELTAKNMIEKRSYLHSFNEITAINRDTLFNDFILKKEDIAANLKLIRDCKFDAVKLLNCDSTALPFILQHAHTISWYIEDNSIYTESEIVKYNNLMKMNDENLLTNIKLWRKDLNNQLLKDINLLIKRSEMLKSELSNTDMLYNFKPNNYKSDDNSKKYNLNTLWKLPKLFQKQKSTPIEIELSSGINNKK